MRTKTDALKSSILMESQQLQTLCPWVRYNVYLNILPGNENINGIAHNFKHYVLEFDFYNI